MRRKKPSTCAAPTPKGNRNLLLWLGQLVRLERLALDKVLPGNLQGDRQRGQKRDRNAQERKTERSKAKFRVHSHGRKRQDNE
jgi:hypothetical protein